MLPLDELFHLNSRLTKNRQFSKCQWEEIINLAFTAGRDMCFNWGVEHFYIGLLGFDYEDCEDLITDIQNGEGKAIDKFVNDIVNYFNSK